MADFTVEIVESPALEVIVELAGAGAAGVTDHGALTGLSDDDHTQYHTDARAATWGDARYIRTVNDTGPDVDGNVDIVVEGGTTDHGALTGLADDDHTQYHTDARAATWGDARYEPLDSAYTKAEADTRYVNETDHTKAAHDALDIDADTLDGHDTAFFATASSVSDHLGDTTDAHDASAISILDTANQYTATNAESALAEVLDALQAHEADGADAHDASAISFSPTGTVASTDVQSAIAEAASEAAGAAGHRTLVTLGSDVTNATSTLADVTGLSFPVTSGVIKRFYFLIVFDSQATATGSRWTLNGPSATSLYAAIRWTQANNSFAILNISAYGGGTASATSLSTGNVCTIEGAILPSASGTLIAQFASEAPGANNTITAKAGSTVEYW